VVLSWQLLQPLILSFGISFAVTPLVIWIYRRFGWVDDPKKNNHPKVVHTKPVPRGGGIPIFLAVGLLSLYFLPLDKHLIGILLGALTLVIVGILDDIYDLNPKIRLVANFLSALLVIGSGVGIAFVSNPFGEGLIYLNEPQIPIYLLGKVRTIWILADLFALFWIAGLMNFMNWSKGLDGQLPGVAAIAAIVVALLSLKFSADITQWEVTALALLVAGAYLGFLPWNFFPQKIMPGYGGGALAGYFLAILAILSTTKVGTLLVVLGIPIIDALFVIIRRIMTGQSPLKGDTRHLHHTLMQLGWSKRKIAFFYWIITAGLGFIALQLNSRQKFYTILLLALAFVGFLLWIKLSNTSLKPRDQDNG
jgi:UDP-GlcNAc:undecaprenyl-phosphate GlcNAc-1-phosphate transferase